MTDNPASLRPGDVLAGKYRVERVIGVGGMGIVVAARHEQLDQLVAIKLVRQEALSTGDAAERFMREARAAAKLKSEHVAKVLDVGTLDTGAPFMVMELLDGTDLASVLESYGPIPFEMAACLVAQACEAVAEAHACGIIHRDLKPHNLFLTWSAGGTPKIKVLDFGVSKAVGRMSSGGGSLTGTRAMLGSPLYMAPEQMRSSRDVDARADVWALGVVLFELLTRRWPFEAETMPELCLKVVSDPPISLAALRPETPAALIAIVERCLEKTPARRYANARELAEALEQFVPTQSRMAGENARIALPRPPPRSSARGPTPGTLPLAAWGGSLQGTSMLLVRGFRRTASWAIGALAIAGGVLLAFVLSGTRKVLPPPVAAPLHESALEPVLADLPSTVVSLPPAPTLPPAADLAASVTVTAASAIPSAAPRGAQAVRTTAQDRATHQTPVVRTLPAARPSAQSPVTDDDIPALR
ncbi:MAG: serine/threonine protein kinase [Polyangiaceae bacterium]|nr:serine/threonine protein kinase [Polyangiaceae bacterium]